MPAQVHYRWERRLPNLHGLALFSLLFFAGLSGLFYFTVAIINGPPTFFHPYYYWRVASFFGFVLFWALWIVFTPRRRRSQVILVLHRKTGASVYFQLHVGGKKFKSQHWNHIQRARWETQPDPEGDGGKIHILWGDREGRKPANLSDNGVVSFTLFTEEFRNTLAAEINRQQDGSWKTQKKVLGDTPEVDDMEIEPGWDEGADGTDPAATG